MGAIVTDKQSNMSWTITWKAAGRYPIVADRIYDTLADAQAYVDDLSATASAIPGLVLSVVNDEKNNGIYFVQSVAKDADTPGVLVKAGTGEKLTAATYEEALALAIADNIGAVVYVSTETENGKAGLYVITGEGAIERLGTTTATGDLSGDVADLKTDVATLKGGAEVAGSIDYKINEAVADYAKSKDVEDALAGKVSTEGYVAYSQEEKEKLAKVQENVIEQIIYNGEKLVVDAQTKSVTIVTPEDKVRGLADGEKVLSLDETSGKLGTTLSIEYFRDSADNNTPKLRLKGVNGAQVGEAIEVSDFVKDGMLTNVELVENPDGKTGTYFRFTWNTDSGLEPVVTDLDVTGLIDVYEAGDGIAVTGKVISAKVKENDPFLQVTTEGIATKGITTAITEAKNAVIGTSDDTSANLTLRGVKAYAAELVKAHENAVSAIKVTDVDTKASEGISLTKSDAGVIGVSVSKADLATSLIGSTGEVGVISGATVKLGQAITDGTEAANEVISATTSIHAAIQTLAGQIQAAVAGGITAIDGGEYITVGGTATNKTLAVNVAKIGTYLVDNTSALKVDAETGKLTLEWETL